MLKSTRLHTARNGASVGGRDRIEQEHPASDDASGGASPRDPAPPLTPTPPDSPPLLAPDSPPAPVAEVPPAPPAPLDPASAVTMRPPSSTSTPASAPPGGDTV